MRRVILVLVLSIATAMMPARAHSALLFEPDRIVDTRTAPWLNVWEGEPFAKRGAMSRAIQLPNRARSFA